MVETLLVDAGFTLMVQRVAEPRLVNVDYGRSDSGLEVPQINYADLGGRRDHPAYLVGTFIMLDACDTRLIADSLQYAVPDSGLPAIVPLGTSGAVLVQGRGSWVCELTDMLLEVNEAARARSEASVKPEP